MLGSEFSGLSQWVVNLVFLQKNIKKLFKFWVFKGLKKEKPENCCLNWSN